MSKGHPSYENFAEATEVIIRLAEIQLFWDSRDVTFDMSTVCVVSFYPAQVGPIIIVIVFIAIAILIVVVIFGFSTMKTIRKRPSSSWIWLGEGLERAWRGLGEGLERAWRGLGEGLERAWRGLGEGLERDQKANIVCSARVDHVTSNRY